MQFNLYKNQIEQLDAIIGYLSRHINEVLLQQHTVTIALSGGKSPIALFNKLSQVKSIPWDKITLTLVDERITNSENPDSNAFLVRTNLLQNLAKSAKFKELVTLDSIGINEVLLNANNTVDKIDIIILGMGDDGHTASIFPDCKEFNEAINLKNQPAYIETNPISARYKRVSLNLSALIKAKYLILSINGNHKINVLKEASKQINNNYPISYLLFNRPDLQAFCFE